MNTFYYILPNNDRSEILTYDEYNHLINVAKVEDPFGQFQDINVDEAYNAYVETCEKYNCTMYEVDKFISDYDNVTENFNEQIKTKYPDAILLK